MSIRRRILEPIALLIAIGVLACLWISIAALHTHERARAYDRRAWTTLASVQDTQAALATIEDFVFELIEFNTLIRPDVVRERFASESERLLGEIGALHRLEIDAQMAAAVGDLEREATTWIGEAAAAVGVMPASAIPAPHYLRRQSARIADAMAAVDATARSKATQLASAAQDRFIWQMGGALAVMAAVFAIAAAIALRRAGHLIRALRGLAQAMEDIRSGRFETTVNDQDRDDEVGAMARGVADFAKGLRELTQAKERIEHMALHDPLTGLSNRRSLQEYLKRLLSRLPERTAVLHVDLDRFKQVNDTLGHAVGDSVLQAAARGMLEQVRPSDFIARVGGDEFVIVLSEVDTGVDTAGVARRVIAAVSRPTTVDDVTAQIGASIGIALASDAQGDPQRLLVNADIALYEAKGAGRGQYCFYSEAARHEVERRTTLAHDLRAAIERGEIVAFFQPQLNDATGCLIGFEALMRWRHSTLSIIAPGEFLEVAFENGLGDVLSTIMIEAALDALRYWRAEGLEAPRVSVNLAAQQLRDRGFVDRLLRLVAQARLAPRDVAVEVVESVLLHDAADPAVANVAALQELGFPIELDDFGTGHASISNLKRFKVDRIKIDRGFVAGIQADSDQATIVKALIDLARNLGIECLAEGVETAAERSKLISLGCSLFQGYGIGMPMPLDEATDWLRARRRETARRAPQVVA